ncbi:MAG: hemolysin family protein [Firmicutes bacterium]|nr:hemolysin family protein [Bacillota bacterium]
MLTKLLLLMLLIIINAFFTASEIALISLNDNKIRWMAEDGNKKAQLIRNLLAEPSRFLATSQIGITLAGFMASAFAAETFSDQLVTVIKLAGLPLPGAWLHTLSVVLITLVLSYFTRGLGELVPKRGAMTRSEQIAMQVAQPLTFLSRLAFPIVKLLTLSTNFFVRLFGVHPGEEDQKVTEEEIRMMVDVGEEIGSIHENEKQMINNIFEFNNKIARDIMTHRTDIAALPVEAGLAAATDFFRQEKYSRIPVYEGSMDNIVGVMHAKDLIAVLADSEASQNFSLKNMMRLPYFVAATKPTDQLFAEMQRSKIHLAVIIDEYGGTSGIVTLEDLLEEIVGDILDEDDEEEKRVHKVDANTYMIDGAVSLDTVKDYLEVELPVEDYVTLSGFIIGQIGRIPDKADKPTVNFNGWSFKVDEVTEKKIAHVLVRRMQPQSK